jgi:hypothetical protein
MSADNASQVADHVVTLTGLPAQTRFHYSIGTLTQQLLGNSSNYFFTTSPPSGSKTPSRIWVIGDSGQSALGFELGAGQRAVRNAYDAYTGSRTTDLWLMLGDNAYNFGTDAEYQTGLFDVYPALLRNSPLWPCPGNHDYASGASAANQTGPYYDIFSLPTNGELGGAPSGTEAYYSFDYANIHLISLDSHDSSRAPGGTMLTWLRNDLAATHQDWIIAYWHHPPYSNGSHDSDTEIQLVEMRANVLPILEAAGVDLVLSGHSHSYERSYLIHGHYGISTTLASDMILDRGDGRLNGSGPYIKAPNGTTAGRGAVYIVAGSASSTSGGALNYPAMFKSLNTLGSVILDVDGQRLDAKFLDDMGRVQDSLSIVKSTQASQATADARVYPVPFRPNNRDIDDGIFYHSGNPDSGIIFDRLPSEVKVKIYSLSGRLIRALSSHQNSGRLQWDAKDGAGQDLPSGLYFATINGASGESSIRKIMIVR